jgi:hypothetical protein
MKPADWDVAPPAIRTPRSQGAQAAHRNRTWGIGCDAPGSPILMETGIDPTSKTGKNCESVLRTRFRFRVAERMEGGAYAATGSTLTHSQRRRIDTMPAPAQVPPRGLSTRSCLGLAATWLVMGALSVLLIGSAGWVMAARRWRWAKRGASVRRTPARRAARRSSPPGRMNRAGGRSAQRLGQRPDVIRAAQTGCGRIESRS